MTAKGNRTKRDKALHRLFGPLWRVGYAYTPEWWNVTDRIRVWLNSRPINAGPKDQHIPDDVSEGLELLFTDYREDGSYIKGPGVNFRFPGPPDDDEGFIKWAKEVRFRAATSAIEYCRMNHLAFSVYEQDRDKHVPERPQILD